MRAVDRRQFIRLCGCAACGALLTLAGCRQPDVEESGDTTTATAAVPTSASPAEATTPATATPATLTQTGTVRCPRRQTWDPYPGRCRQYRDSNGNGYCDWSEPA
ncbi:MAG: twin-arginine translocation signal domain-containing protein [Anaerolineales bacterium]